MWYKASGFSFEIEEVIFVWKWVGDERIVREFAKLRVAEVVACIAYVAGDMVLRFVSSARAHEYLSYLGWMVLGVVLFSRFEILKSAFKLPARFSFADVRHIDSTLYLLLLGALVLYAGVVVLVPGSLLTLLSSVKGVVSSASIAYFAFLVCKEEVMYRVLLYYSVNRIFGRTAAFFVCITVFALLHDYNMYYPIAVLPAAISFSLCTILWGSIVPSIVLHAILNIVVYLGVVSQFSFF